MSTHKIILRLSFLTALAGFVGCSGSTPFVFLQRGGTNPSPVDPVPLDTPPPSFTPPPEETPPPGGYVFVSQEWLQPTGGTIPVDLIFVEDTSGSLDAERTAMKNAISGFLSTLEAQGISDYCVGVMFAHGGTRAGLVRGYQDVAANKCLCASEFSSSTALITEFGKNLTSSLPADNASTDGGEVGIYSFHESFTNSTKLEANQTAGCYRNTAALVPIFLSDENDISTSHSQSGGNCGSSVYTFTPEGPASLIDPDCQEAPARLTYYSDGSGNLTLGYQDLLDDAEAFQAPLPFFSTTVGYVGTLVSNGENEYPYGFAELTEASGGDLVDLKDATDGNQAAFNASFANLGENVAKKATLQTVFDLAHLACAGTVLVDVGGSAVTSFTTSVNPSGNTRVKLTLVNAGDAGDAITITYAICD